MASRDQGKWCELDHPELEGVNEGDTLPKERMDGLCRDISKAWEWVWTTSAETDRQMAIRLLGKKEVGPGACSVM